VFAWIYSIEHEKRDFFSPVKLFANPNGSYRLDGKLKLMHNRGIRIKRRVFLLH
jgi:hypothetical protein